jgi:hypothetical protein
MHTDELIAIAHHYYPRGCGYDDSKETEEHRRLVEARKLAGTGTDRDRWRTLLDRLGAKFPGNGVQNRSIHLEMGSLDACYSGAIHLPHLADEHSHAVGFLVSFVVPYYIVYSDRVVDDLDALKAYRESASSTFVSVYVGDKLEFLPAEEAPGFRKKFRRRVLSFEFSPDEQPFAAWIAREIETTFGAERMPPEVGQVRVPNISTNLRSLGEAKLYDCLFSDSW